MKKRFLLTSLVVMAFTGAIFATGGTEPALSRVNASPFVEQVQEYNNAGTSGVFDPTFGINGSLNIDSLLSGGQARAMQVLPNGNFLTVVSKTGSASQVGMYNAQGRWLGSIALGASQSALDSMIDRQGRLLVCGGITSGTAGWIYRVNTTLTSATAFTTNFAWQYVNGLAEQSTGNIIAVGFNGAGLYGQIGRYKLDGTIDTTFGTSGFVTLNGSGNLPIVTTGLASVTVDGQDRMYVAFTPSVTRNGFASGSAYLARFTPAGELDTNFGSASGIVALDVAFDTAITGFEVAQDVHGNIIVASNVTEGGSNQIVVAAMTSSGSALPGFTTFDSSFLDVFASFLLESLMTTQDGSILIGGTCNFTGAPLLAVIKLVGTTGHPDLTFNNSKGYNLFYNITAPDTQAVVASMALAPDGRLYTADFQINSGVTTSYISRLYNTPYDSQVAQAPEITEQGVFDTAFGSAAVSPNLQSFRGVTMPYNGNFGQNLQQKTRGIIELASGDFLLGSDGYTGSTSHKTMMLTWLTSAGILDTSFGTSSSGKLTLANVSSTDESMAALAEGRSGIIYVAGTNGTPVPFIRSYSSAGVAITSLNDTGTASVGIAIQGGAGILLFAQDSATTGHISRYTSSAGILALDTANFGSSGKIATGALGLNMGPVYGGGLVNRADDIIIAYKNSSTGAINVAMINKAGTALIPVFGTAGIAFNVFGDTTIPASNVRIAFDSNIRENIYVAAVSTDGLHYLITRLNGITGVVDPTFNGGLVLSISPESVVTALTLTNLTGVSNGTVMLTGYDAAVNPVMLTMRVTSVDNVATLDTTFNSQGAIPGVAPMQIEDETANYSARVATGLAIQSNSVPRGKLIYSAYESQTLSQSTPETFRLFAQTGTVQVQRFPLQDQAPGTLDIALNDCGALDIVASTGTGVAKVVYAYPVGNLHAGKVLIGVDSGSALYIIRVDETLATLDQTFAGGGLYEIDGLTGLQNIMVDAHNRIIINGTTSTSAAWVQRIPENGDGALTLFNMPADITSANMVYQQKSGRYIVAGSTSLVGTMVAFQDEVVAPATGLAVDITFNPLATGSSAEGRWNIAGSTSLYSLAINSDDSIYTAYQDGSSHFLTIAQVLANGAGLDTAFNTTGLLATPIIPDNASVIRVAVDAYQNVIVAASCGAGTSLKAFRCNSTGGTSTQFTNGGIVSNHVATTTLASSTGIVLKALLEDTNGKTILIGSTSDSSEYDENGTMFAVRLNGNGQLDLTWNPSAIYPDVPGVVTFGAAGNPLTPAITIMSNATINIPGNILAVGGNGTDPILMEIVGDTFITGVQQGQLEGAAGILDTTLLEPSGALNLVTPLPSLAVAGYTPDKLYIYPNGSMLMGMSNGTATTLTKVNATLALDSTFNSGAIVHLGAGTAYCKDMFVANATGQDGTIYVTGSTSGGALWSGSITPDGLDFTSNAAIADWPIGTAIRLAGNGDIIVAGFDGTHGAVAAFLPNGAALDQFFGTDGVYTTNSNFPISAMTIDNVSRMYIAYIDNSIEDNPITVQRLNPNGTLDTTFAAVPIPGSWSWGQIKLSLDEANNQLVVAAQNGTGTGNVLQVVRLSTLTGNGTGFNVGITILGKVLSLSDLFIDTNQEIYVLGTNITGSRAIVARLTSVNATTIALDPSYAAVGFAPAGVANLAIPSMTTINAGALDPDRRVYLLGNNGISTAYMARVFGNNYYTQVSQATSSAILGELDYSYGVAGVATNYAGEATSPSDNQQARAIVPLPVGSHSMTIIGDGIHSWTLRLLANGTNDPLYGGGQGVAIAQQATGNEIVQGMVFDSSGNAIVCGSNSVGGGYIKSVLPSGSMNPGFGGGTGYVYIPQFDVINAVAQLSNGNFIAVGYQAGVGKIAMMQQDGALMGVITAGIDVTSASIDALDNIYVALTTTASSIISACVAKYDATGALVSSYGVGGVAANVITNLDSAAHVRLVLDTSGKVVVAASGNGGAGSVSLIRLNFDGSIDTSFNAGVPLNIPFAEGTSGVVTSLSALQNGNYYVAGYQYDSNDVDNNDYEFVAAVTSAGILDVNFNAIGAVPGLLTFQVAVGEQTGRNVWGMGIAHNGQILLAGSEGPESGGEIPLTMSVNGYPGVRAVPQFTGPAVVIPTDVNPEFGIAYTFPAILDIVEGGYTAVDSQNRILVGGRTSSQTFVVARFLKDGLLDPVFGSYVSGDSGPQTGVAQTGPLTTLLSGSFITLDGSDNVYIGGVTTDNAFIVAKFTDAGILDTTFNSGATAPLVPGVAQSLTTANVIRGGYVTIDYIENVIIGGMTADQKLSLARFTSTGAQDHSFGTGGVAQTPTISNLNYGGYVATAIAAPELFPDLNDNSIYVGASTYGETLLIAKFDRFGVLEPTYSSPGVGFGLNGIAQTAIITNLLGGGSLSLDKDRIVAIGGYTSDQTFVAAKFLPSGDFDPAFGTDGIAYSIPLLTIDSFGDLAIDSNNNILLGGISTAYDGISKSMVVARLTPLGTIDTSFGTNGISTSGVIPNLVSGGFVSINILNNVFVGGYNGTQLVVAGLYSGYEFFIDNPGSLPELAKKLFLYGNDPDRFKNMLGIYTFAQFITNSIHQASLLAQVNSSLDEYALAGAGTIGFNLAASLLTIWSLKLDRLQALLKIQGIDNAQVDAFFQALRDRANSLNFALGGKFQELIAIG